MKIRTYLLLVFALVIMLAPVSASNGPGNVDSDLIGSAIETRIWGTSYIKWDTDGDGYGDGIEIITGNNPLSGKNVFSTDADGDKLGDNVEAYYGTDPLNWDTDGDGYGDGIEIAAGMNPLSRDADYPGADTDFDSLSDDLEFAVYNTDPRQWDTDGDGYLDGLEVAAGLDPLDPRSNLNPTGAVISREATMASSIPFAIIIVSLIILLLMGIFFFKGKKRRVKLS